MLGKLNGIFLYRRGYVVIITIIIEESIGDVIRSVIIYFACAMHGGAPKGRRLKALL